MRSLGFSLVELMVAMGIIGILAMLAIPRYQVFMVQSRRAEAKNNLQHLASLQEAYLVEHGGYYGGTAMSGRNGIGYKDGDGNIGNCDDPSSDIDEGLGNRLGFRPGGGHAGCRQLRYFYTMRGASSAIASAAADSGREIYPDCDGYADGCLECGYERGDALSMDLASGNPEVCRNITKYCPLGGCVGGTVLDPCLSTTCPAGHARIPYPPCCERLTCPGCKSNLSYGTTWAPGPGAVYECKLRFLQEGTFTETWTQPPRDARCPPASPCPSPTTRRAYRWEGPGTRPVDCTSTGLDACPCHWDRNSSDTRSCCAPCTAAGSSSSACALNDTSINLANEWECKNFSGKVTVTYTYTPTPTCTPTTTTEDCIMWGTKALTCNALCTWNSWGNYGNCFRTGSGFQQIRTRTRSCNDPCPTQLYCPDEHEYQACKCHDGKTLDDFERTICTDPGDTLVVKPNPDDNKKVKCQCDRNPSPVTSPTPITECTTPEQRAEKSSCTGPKYVWLPAPDCRCDCKNEVSKRGKCRKVRGTWNDYTECTCSPTGGTYNVTFCGSALFHYGIKAVVAALPDDDDLSDLKTQVANASDATDVTTGAWDKALGKIRCGGGRAFPGNANVERFNAMINYFTMKLDGSKKMPAQGGKTCSDDGVAASYTCS